MKKTVYMVMEENYTPMGSCDNFDIAYTFDLDEARVLLEDNADRGYRLNKANPSITKYVIYGYDIDTDDIDEDVEYDINDAKSLYFAYSKSVCFTEFTYDEEYKPRENTIEELVNQAIETIGGWGESRQKEAIEYIDSYVSDWYKREYNLTDDEINHIAEVVSDYFKDE